MPTLDPRVDAYIADSAEFAQPILEHIRAIVHETCPDVEETMKWSFPHFQYKGMLCSMASFKAHCALNFWKGELLIAAEDDKGKEAMGQRPGPKRPASAAWSRRWSGSQRENPVTGSTKSASAE